MRFYWLTLGVLAVWRLTHLLHAEDGPWDVVVRARRAVGRAGRVLDCFYCLSVWVALPFALLLGHDLLERLVLWPALSAGAILAERATGRPADAPAEYVEALTNPSTEQEDGHVMLRPATERVAPEPRERDGAPDE